MLDQEVIKLKKRLFIQAYRKHEGNIAAVRHSLGISHVHVYKLYKLFSKEELSDNLVTPKARRRSNLKMGFRRLKVNN